MNCVTCGTKIYSSEVHLGDGVTKPVRCTTCERPTREQEDAYWRDANLRAAVASGK